VCEKKMEITTTKTEMKVFQNTCRDNLLNILKVYIFQRGKVKSHRIPFDVLV
jgi:hypothetical protein